MNAVEVIECAEHEEIGLPIERLIVDGEIALDSRISKRGYLNISIAEGKVRLRATRFVGLIPLNEFLALKVKPRAKISNLSQMIVRSGNAPTVIENFSRGYRPLIEQSDRATEIYHSSFLASVSRIARRGFMKSYVTLTNPPKWRGRLLVSETARRFAAKGVRYDGAFDCKTLSFDIPENQALKATLREVSFWLKQKAMNEELTEANGFLRAFAAIKDWQGPIERLIADIPQLAKTLPSHLSYYREPLWTSYAILQGGFPNGDTSIYPLQKVRYDLGQRVSLGLYP